MPAVRTPESVEASGGPPRKKMRQGTHSCIECRRRKIKCIFHPDRQNVCNECFGRGIQCIDQESAADVQTAETRQSLRERVAQLESLVRNISQKMDLDDSSSVGSATQDPAKHKASLPDLVAATSGNEHAPIMTLFNNGLISGQVDEESSQAAPASAVPSRVAANAQYGSGANEERIRRKLLAVVPSNKDIDSIFAHTSQWQNIWRHIVAEVDPVNSGSFADYVKRAVASGPLLTLCKALLLLSLGMQQVPASIVQELSLPRSTDDLIFHYVTTIEESVTSNDRFCSDLNALECIVLTTKLDSHAGRPRKAWLANRRAISFALLLGLHRASSWVETAADRVSGPRRRNIFLSLYTADRAHSLMLGLPYTLSDQQCDIEKMADDPDTEAAYPVFSVKNVVYVSKLAGRLIDRTHNPALATLDETMREDKELEALANKLPPMYVPETADAAAGGDNFDRAYYRCLSVFAHYSMRSVLHLPFFLKSGADRRYEYNRQAALESARHMLGAYVALQTRAQNGFCVCKTVDFQAFQACVMLLLNRYGFARFPGAARDRAREDADEALILDVKRLFEKNSAGQTAQGDNVQDQSAKMLSLFLSIDCNKEDGGACGPAKGGATQQESYKVVVPYFGTITVKAGKDCEGIRPEPLRMPTPAPSASSAASLGRRSGVPTPAGAASFSPATAQGSPRTGGGGGPPWGMPTPPGGSSSQSGASPPNPFMDFYPFNVPLPGGGDGSGPGLMAGADPAGIGGPAAFADPLLAQQQPALTGAGAWFGGGGGAAAWPSMAAGGEFDFELDNNWSWMMTDGSQLPGTSGK